MHVAALTIDLHLPDCHTLKAKRGLLKPLLEGTRRRYNVAVAEIADQEKWQRAGIGVAVVASSVSHATEVLDEVERYVWSFPEVQVLDITRHWLEVTQ
ncbi:MAG: DUF503 domain-containing protein [Acidimicrobiales bacterium]